MCSWAENHSLDICPLCSSAGSTRNQGTDIWVAHAALKVWYTTIFVRKGALQECRAGKSNVQASFPDGGRMWCPLTLHQSNYQELESNSLWLKVFVTQLWAMCSTHSWYWCHFLCYLLNVRTFHAYVNWFYSVIISLCSFFLLLMPLKTPGDIFPSFPTPTFPLHSYVLIAWSGGE